MFKLYDTYGFPADMTADVAREHGLAVDQPGFDEAMAEQRERGRISARFDASIEQSANVDSDVSFTGYTAAEGAAEVLSLFEDGTE